MWQRLFIHKLLLVFFSFFLVACHDSAPTHQTHICGIFKTHPSWYWDAKRSATRWHVPISVQMAILHRESHFNAGAIPPREKILGIVPWLRESSAYGYAQALDETWQLYKSQTGNFSASRSSFSDAVDFIGWFSARAHRRLGISLNNAYQLYLAYHEGIEGYRHHTYRFKLHVIYEAHRVQHYANLYHQELNRCRDELPPKPWWRFWR